LYSDLFISFLICVDLVNRNLKALLFFNFSIILTRSHNDSHRKQHEARLSRHRIVHIHVIKKKRRSTHVEGEDDSEDYIASKGVKLQREHVDLEWTWSKRESVAQRLSFKKDSSSDSDSNGRDVLQD
jgi:hypothetical protein